jgi:hypothetical protein
MQCIQVWTDDMLYWDPLAFGNVSDISVPHDVIWLPDTVLYNK